MDDINEKELIQMTKIPATRDAGFRVIYNRYHRTLYGYIRKMVITHENADDVLQNTMIKVFSNISKFREEASLKSWMYRIAHNEALQFIRNNKRQVTENSDEIREFNLYSDPWFKGEKIHQLLLDAIACLPERQKQVFELKYFEDFKYTEIADVLQVTEGSLKASYHHAVTKITEYVKENSDVI